MALRVILIGAGKHGYSAYGQQVLPPLVAEGRIAVVGVIEPEAERLQAAVEALGLDAAQGFDTLEAFLKTGEADVAIIASPFKYHEAACVACARAGMQLFIEKPVSDTLESCCRIHKDTTEAGVKAAVNMSARFEVEKRAFAAALQNPAYGKAEYIFARMSWDHSANAFARAEAPHPYIMEGGVHTLDMLRGYAGGKPQWVHSMGWKSPTTVFQGIASNLVSFQMDNGVCCALEGSWTVQAGINTWRNEYIRADMEHGALLLDHQKLQWLSGTEMSAEGLQVDALASYTEHSENKGTDYLFRAFLEWVNGEREDHPTPLADNLQCMALLFAAVESAQTRQVVDVQAFLHAAQNAV